MASICARKTERTRENLGAAFCGVGSTTDTLKLWPMWKRSSAMPSEKFTIHKQKVQKILGVQSLNPEQMRELRKFWALHKSPAESAGLIRRLALLSSSAR